MIILLLLLLLLVFIRNSVFLRNEVADFDFDFGLCN